MKKFYETPVAEKVTFQYQEQVTASGAQCGTIYQFSGTNGNCPIDEQKPVTSLN